MTECQAVTERRELTEAIALATGSPQYFKADGSEEQLKRAFSVLEGIFHEYCDGGDQMVEGCTCGQHSGSGPLAS